MTSMTQAFHSDIAQPKGGRVMRRVSKQEWENEHMHNPMTEGEALAVLRQIADEMRERKVNHGKHYSPTLVAWANRIDEQIAALTAAQQPVQEGGGEVWRCFHCDEVFTDQESAAEHFGTKIRHDPACTIDPAEFRQLQDREADYAEEDAAVHRAMRSMEAQHRLALEREEIKGYERGLRDSGKCPCAAPPSAPVGVEGEGEFWTWLRQAYNFTGAGNFTAYNMEVAYQAGRDSALAQQPAQAAPVPCDAIPKHQWEVLSCEPNEYEPTMESGWQRCKVCGTRAHFNRERTPPGDDAAGGGHG